MANKDAILDKIARNMGQRGITADRVGETVVVENGSNDLTVTYEEKDVQSPMGGIDDTTTPFLGVGVRAPGSLKIEGAGVNTANPATVGELIDSATAATLLAECAGFANDIQLANANAGAGADLDERIGGDADRLGMGS